ncbi:SDR family NAD(P)-dependent oxidoreductase [Paenibacillus glycanilyticus]|uniref:Short-chain dehydrogenase n=1 Tax=Paenibacillus glycanilyticus TaxID=126569 RepID=A0ABQ6GCK0_9BACL|nr:SDR family NAD(P)-dependent oxidoreductase [Paenibacillus glycanilyticus]GLX68000.1 short-chain dehydrogenase [Paenibacillus glycanilyticus]
MPKKQVYIITGVSGGLGAELATQLLSEGNDVIGLSRTDHPVLEQLTGAGQYSFYPIDLTQADTSVLHEIISALQTSPPESITLINNAASVTPLNRIEDCTDEQILANIQLNITAPMLLISAFIRLTAEWPTVRRVVNISSGSGSYPAPEMSLYCSGKAAINMFSRCVGMEQEQSNNPVQVFSIDPGMMDTAMQRTARESDMALSAYFAAQHEEGNLVEPASVAQKIIDLISSQHLIKGELQKV